MHVTSLKLYQFRNIQSCSITCGKGVTLFLGRNGQGKSNLLEAISLLARARSFRTSKIKECVTWGQEQGSVFGTVENRAGRYELGVILDNGKRTVTIDGKNVSTLQDYLGRFAAITFAPHDLEVVKGGPERRRAFIDRHVVDAEPQMGAQYAVYAKLVKTKVDQLRKGIVDENALRSIEQLIARHTLVIKNARRRYLDGLTKHISGLYDEFAQEDGGISISLHDTLEGGEDEQSILKLLSAHRAEEFRQRSVVVGPHRDDLVIELRNKNARSFASQGQARSVILALKLATILYLEEVHGESPVVLLDDVDAELDAGRRDRFFNLIFKKERQFFITATELHDFESRADATYEVNQGVVDGAVL